MISIDGDLNSDGGCNNDYDWDGNQNGRGDDDEDDVSNDGRGVNDSCCVNNHGAADGYDGAIGVEKSNISGVNERAIRWLKDNGKCAPTVGNAPGDWIRDADGGKDVNISVGDGGCNTDADVDNDGSSGDGYNVNDSCSYMVTIMEIAMVLVIMVKLGDCGADGDAYCGDW